MNLQAKFMFNRLHHNYKIPPVTFAALSVSVSLYMCNLYLFCTKLNIQVVWIFCTSAVIHMEEKRREEKKRERQEYLYLSVIHRVVEEK